MAQGRTTSRTTASTLALARPLAMDWATASTMSVIVNSDVASGRGAGLAFPRPGDLLLFFVI